MKIRKLILTTGILSMSIVGTANAAVYGTIKNDLEVQAGERLITKAQGETVTILEKEEETYIIALDDKVEYKVDLGQIELVGTLTNTTDTATKLRTEADPEADIIDFLEEDMMVLAIGKEANFYKVKVDDKEGYIYKSQINETDLEGIPYKTTIIEAEQPYIGEKVVAYAKGFLGGRYVYGGNNLLSGVDCSGFTQQIMKDFEISIQRSSKMQYSHSGYKVSVDQILPGDLVFYGSNGKTVDHVAIYAGNGEIIHASDARSGIKMSRLYYGKPLIGVKRVLA